MILTDKASFESHIGRFTVYLDLMVIVSGTEFAVVLCLLYIFEKHETDSERITIFETGQVLSWALVLTRLVTETISDRRQLVFPS